MDWLVNLAQNESAPLVAALALGLLTAISPCPLATNITATAYIAKSMSSKRKVLLSGLVYTLGRMVSYTAIGMVIYLGASKFHIARAFQANGEKFVGPLLILLGLFMLGVIPLHWLFKGSLSERFTERFKDRGMLGAFLLGMLFALAFCPYSGALYFGMLMPLTLASRQGLLLPAIFSLGTGVPVMLFAGIVAYSASQLGRYFKAVQKTEPVMRIVAGFTFILTGLYYLNIYLKII
jgi:cytochrome c biogenesis protein CcdA